MFVKGRIPLWSIIANQDFLECVYEIVENFLLEMCCIIRFRKVQLLQEVDDEIRLQKKILQEMCHVIGLQKMCYRKWSCRKIAGNLLQCDYFTFSPSSSFDMLIKHVK